MRLRWKRTKKKGASAAPLSAAAQKGKRARRGGQQGAGMMIMTVVIVFAMVVGLMIWIQGLFADMDRRLTDTQRQVELMSAARMQSPPAQAAATSETAPAAEGQADDAADVSSDAQEPDPSLETVIGRVVDVEKAENFWNVTIDPAQLLTGKAASSIAAHRGDVPINGRYLDDATHSTREIPCSEGAPVSTLGGDSQSAEPTDAKGLFAALKGEHADEMGERYFLMTIDSDYIVSFEEFSLSK